jgi:hypothetical protein
VKIPKACKIELAASKDEGRYRINEPWLDLTNPEEPVLVATNGASMAIIPVEAGEYDKTGVVTAESLKAYRKVKLDLEIVCNGKLTVQDGPEFKRPELDGGFPNYKQVVPADDRKPYFVAGINVKLLWELVQAMGCEAATLEFSDEGNLGAIVVRPANGSALWNKAPACREARGIIMPIRTSQSLHSTHSLSG